MIDIDRRKLPQPDVVAEWDGRKFAETLRHDQSCGRYSTDFRQLLHVGYKVAAEMRGEFTDAVADSQRIIPHKAFGEHLLIDPSRFFGLCEIIAEVTAD